MKTFRVWLNWEIKVKAKNTEDAKQIGLVKWAHEDGEGWYIKAEEIKEVKK